MNLLFMLGARVINSYMQPALKKYDAALSAFDRGLGQEEYLYINAYVSRLSGILNGREPVTDTFVYYPIEDVQAKFTPSSRNDYFRDKWLLMLDDSLRWLAKLVHFGWADAEGSGKRIEGTLHNTARLLVFVRTVGFGARKGRRFRRSHSQSRT